MNFCEFCGARLGSGPYCGNCGRAVSGAQSEPVVADASVTQPVDDPDATRVHEARSEGDATRLHEQSLVDEAVPASRHPFGDIGVADYVRDAVALVLLIASLSMPWDATGEAADRLHVVLVTLLAMASLTLPYLRRAGVLPDGWGNAEVRVARVLANVPYFVVVALTIIIDIAANGPVAGGVGVGVGIGLAGAVLAAQARAADHDGHGQGRLWQTIAIGIAGVVVALTIVRLVVVLVRLGDTPSPDWGGVAMALLEPLIFLAVLLLPVVGVLARRSSARNVLVAVGVIGLVMAFWRMSDGSPLPTVLSMRDGGPMELLWLAVAAAISAAGVSRLMAPEPQLQTWVGTAVRGLGLAAVLSGGAALFWIAVVTAFDVARGTSITVLILLLLAVVTAVVGQSAVRNNARQGRAVAIAASAMLILLATVDLAVETAGTIGLFAVSALVISGLIVMAGLVVLALTAPKPVRDELGPLGVGDGPFGSQPRT